MDLTSKNASLVGLFFISAAFVCLFGCSRKHSNLSDGSIIYELTRSDGSKKTKHYKTTPAQKPNSEEWMTYARADFGNESGFLVTRIPLPEAAEYRIEGKLVEGKGEGIFRGYAEISGKLTPMFLQPYQNDQKHGHCVTYFPDGTAMSEGDWLHGTKDGIWIFNTSKIKPIMTVSFKDDALHGETKIYDKKGALIAQGEYQSGKPLNGSFISDPWKLILAPANYEFTLQTELMHFRNGTQIDSSPITLDTGI